MTDRHIRTLLARFKRGAIGEAALLKALNAAMAEPLGFATIDHHRALRRGFPEVIYAEGKTPAQVATIAARLHARNGVLLATRATPEHFRAVRRTVRRARYNTTARVITAGAATVPMRGRGMILVVTAGTSDLPVAEEALETARIMGNRVELLADVGVAGIHRILAQSRRLHEASVVIVVAGMEGALASVVGGLVDVPVIAVPTSVGYGSHFQGLAALLGMLNSCSSGVTVVNIDNGFGAGVAAGLINRERE
jgi:NCAIR mutase (PurE)-related protein